MKKAIVLAAALAVVGCSGIAEFRDRPADKIFESSRSPQEVANCILYGWQGKDQTYGVVLIQPAPNGFSVYPQGQYELVDVTNNGKLTSIKYYQQSSLYKSHVKTRINIINSCL
ncbi:hypothetical protein [Morganella morganii]|uniref:hypothetical protein n=1 Tax=Morganella morganii TaxID=582 RepID=UPI0010FE2C02|nr:hypothetical protein [Morganella morganii]MBS9543657.1 hypothetical protein [Morganella morganii subsp. morganii]MDM8753527.1 hypothetical protein [Morganella morganii]